MLAMLQQRLATDPGHADSWRLIGRIHRKQGQLTLAIQAAKRSLDLDPLSAAAHFDYGELLSESGDALQAAVHFQQVFALAPDSSYAGELVNRGLRPTGDPTSAAVAGAAIASQDDTDGVLQTVGYEIQTFDGADDLDRRIDQLTSDALPQLRRLRIFLETGVLYNSNVSLTPISRELTGSDAASLQGFFNPEVEWIAVHRGLWRSGPLARGYFTVNEGNWSAFDLASFQPGGFIERDIYWGGSDRIGRIDYVYALDLLDGDRLGDRHAITTSLTTIRPDADVVYAFLTTSFSQFDDDGPDPAVDSLDGPAVSAGISRFFQTSLGSLPTCSLGASVESADTEGADFRYNAFSLHGDATWQIGERWSLVPDGSIGYRNYGDFTGSVSRDELTWRIGSRLRWQPTPVFALSAVVRHDRFASDNETFDAERTEGGIVTTLLY